MHLCKCGARVNTERVMRNGRWQFRLVEPDGLEHWCDTPYITDEDRTQWQQEWREQFPQFSARGSWERLLQRDAERAVAEEEQADTPKVVPIRPAAKHSPARGEGGIVL